jgi:hypothetical protein
VGRINDIRGEAFSSEYRYDDSVRIVDRNLIFTIPQENEIIKVLTEDIKKRKEFENNFPFGAKVLSENDIDVEKYDEYDKYSIYEEPFLNSDGR